jgi:hypothetical protein
MDIIILHNPVDEHSPEDILDIERQARWIESVLCGLGHQVSLLQFDAAGIAARRRAENGKLSAHRGKQTDDGFY